MKDVLKRIVIVGIFILCVALVLGYFSKTTNTQGRDSTNEVQDSNTTNLANENEVEEPEVIEKETDEIEQYENAKARVSTTLNFRTEPNIEASKISQLAENTVVDVKAKIRNRLV